jgi:hypothetical protein
MNSHNPPLDAQFYVRLGLMIGDGVRSIAVSEGGLALVLMLPRSRIQAPDASMIDHGHRMAGLDRKRTVVHKQALCLRVASVFATRHIATRSRSRDLMTWCRYDVQQEDVGNATRLQARSLSALA